MAKTARRQPGSGSLHQRASDGRWIASVDVGYHDDGRRKRKTVSGLTQADCLEKMRKVQRDVLLTGSSPTSGLTVEAWLTRWLEEFAARKVKPKTLDTYASYVRRYLVPAIGRRRLDKLTPADVRAVHTFILDQGLSPTTAEHAHRLLSKALKDAQRDGLVTQNVATLTDAPTKDDIDPVALSRAQAVTLLQSVASDPLASRWLAALVTGARQGELLGLRWSFVDLEAGVMDLAWSLQRVTYAHGCGVAVDKVYPCARRPASCPERRLNIRRGLAHEVLDGNLCLLRPKTKGSTRVVPLIEPLRLAMQLHRETTTPGPHDLVWSRPDGRPIDGRVDYLAWCAALDAAGLPHVTLHSARHTAATLLLETGAPDHVTTRILGHSNVLTTRGYQHVSTSEAMKALTRVGEGLHL